MKKCTPEYLKEYQKKYREAHREKMKLYAKEYREKRRLLHPVRVPSGLTRKEYNKIYREKNKDKFAKYRAEHKEYYRNWANENREKRQLQQRISYQKNKDLINQRRGIARKNLSQEALAVRRDKQKIYRNANKEKVLRWMNSYNEKRRLQKLENKRAGTPNNEECLTHTGGNICEHINT